MRKRIRVLGMSGAMAAAAVVLFIGGLWLAQPAEAQKAAAVLARGAEAVPNPSTVHIVAKVRTPPRDNFSRIGADYDLVPVEVWKQFGDVLKWRVEKPGCVAVMDGASATMLMRPNYGVKFPHPTPATFDAHWLLGLANVQDLLTRELTRAQAKGWELKKTEEATPTGEKQLVVSVEAKARISDDDYSKNKWYSDSDMRRVYRFDAKTHRLQGFEAHLHRPGGDVLVALIDRIEYDKPIKPGVFSLKLPENVLWYQEPQRLADNEKYEKMTPKEVAQAFFEACGRKDWKEAEKFSWSLGDDFKSLLGGAKIVTLGEPFQSETYPGWYVPYEIKVIMSAQFGVCYDNPAKRCIVFNSGRRPDAKQLAQVKPLPDNEKYQKMTPKEAVQAIFNAEKKQDADEMWKFTDGSATVEDLKKGMVGPSTADIRVGEPTPAKEAGYWNVPVEIGLVKKGNLVLRNDNPANRYVVDGGI